MAELADARDLKSRGIPSRAGSTPVSGTKYRGVEQLAARRAHNPEAAGSSPATATKKEKHPFGCFSFLARGAACATRVSSYVTAG